MSDSITLIINGEQSQITANTSVAKLLLDNDYNCDQLAVAVNKNFVPRTEYANFILSSNDQIDIVSPIQGG